MMGMKVNMVKKMPDKYDMSKMNLSLTARSVGQHS